MLVYYGYVLLNSVSDLENLKVYTTYSDINIVSQAQTFRGGKERLVTIASIPWCNGNFISVTPCCGGMQSARPVQLFSPVSVCASKRHGLCSLQKLT